MRETILVVDDEPANLRMLERLLRKEYTVLAATSGAEALEILKSHEVSLIITDQRMPEMNGTELLRQSMDINPEAAKIILTGHSDIEALIDAINSSRVHKYVSKPWDPMQLKEVVQNAVREYRQRIEQRQLLNVITTYVKSNESKAPAHDPALFEPLDEPIIEFGG